MGLRRRAVEREVVTDAVTGHLRLLSLATRGRVRRFYYQGSTCDVIDRSPLGSSIHADSATLIGMAEKGWVLPLPDTSRFSALPWQVTAAGEEEIERLRGGGS